MRRQFHDDIDRLQARLVATASTCDEMLDGAVHALLSPGAPGAAAVIARDAEVDSAYKEIQESVLGLFALQAPVASDLRRLAALLHANIHVERLGDYATNIARTAERVSELDEDAETAAALAEMGQAAVAVSRASLQSLAQGDVELARSLPMMDDVVDDLYLDVFRRLVRLSAASEQRLEWATNMIVVARSIERYGDHAVDVGEQTIYAVTGEVVEMSSNDPSVRD